VTAFVSTVGRAVELSFGWSRTGVGEAETRATLSVDTKRKALSFMVVILFGVYFVSFEMKVVLSIKKERLAQIPIE
jgi:hypothetical protein